MSELADKLEHRAPTQGKRAQATLEQLRQRLGFEDVVATEDRVQVLTMGRPELWVRVSGRGLKALFEKQDTNPLEVK